MPRSLVALLVLCAASPALADGTLSGHVTDHNEQPVGGATVLITNDAGAQQMVRTDPAGRYQVKARAGVYAVVVTFGKTRTTGYVEVVDDNEALYDSVVDVGSEVIEVRDRPRPIEFAKPKQDPLAIPPYSDYAALTDRWSKAWLLLDVDGQGAVTRLRFLKRPGNELDEIAVKHAFGLHFDPARDAQGRPTRSFVVWALEWPSYTWMQRRFGSAQRLPTFMDHVLPDGSILLNVATWPPCKGSGAANIESTDPTLRDCATPDLSKSDAAEPWIAPGGDIARLDKATMEALAQPASHESRTPAIVATATTGLMIAGVAFSFAEYLKYNHRTNDGVQLDPNHVNIGSYIDDYNRMQRWERVTSVFAGATLVSGAISAYLWSRQDTHLTIQANGESAGLGYGGRF